MKLRIRLDVKLLTFLTALVLMLNQTSVLNENSLLNAARWGVLGLYCIVVFLHTSSHKPSRRLYALDALALCFLVYAFASTTYSNFPDTTWQRATSCVLLYIAVFWAIWNYADQAGDEKVLDALIAAAAIIYLVGMVLAPAREITWQTDGRFRGVLINPNSLGLLTIMFFPLVLWRALEHRRRLDYVLVAVMVASVTLSGSRTGFLASLVGALFLLYKAKIKKFMLAGIVVVGLLYGALGTDSSGQNGEDGPSPLSRFSNTDVGTGSGRLDIWEQVVPLIQNELILGHGFGTEEDALKHSGVFVDAYQGSYFHNSYLGMAYQLGMLGVCVFFGPLLFLLLQQLWLRRRRSGVTLSRHHAYQAVLLSGVIGAAFESWVYSVGNAFSFPFWVCVMLLARSNTARRIRTPEGVLMRPARGRPITRRPAFQRVAISSVQNADHLKAEQR